MSSRFASVPNETLRPKNSPGTSASSVSASMETSEWLRAQLATHGELIESDLRRRVLPILLQLGGRMRVVGSGCLLAVGGDLLLVTARHVAELLWRSSNGLRRAAVPGPEGILLPLAGCRGLAGSDEVDLDADVAALRLPPPVGWKLAQRWRPLSAAELAAPPQPAGELHLIAGYPQSLDDPRAPGGRLFALATRALAAAPAQAAAPVHPQYDLFFEYARWGRAAPDQGAQRLPALEGVSGAPVWRLVPQADGGLRLWPVAVQSGYFPNGYIRAKGLGLLRRFL
ncbi:MAG: hypothetical protein QJR02_06780 [Sinobacteraceae bacterium]|nr:hypothetical protein [Nevskiaceae bacterium]